MNGQDNKSRVILSSEDDESMREYGRQLAMDALLEYSLREIPVGQRKARRSFEAVRSTRFGMTLAAAALVLAAAGGIWWAARSGERGTRSAFRSGSEQAKQGKMLARVADVRGDGAWRMEDGQILPLCAGDRLREGVRIGTKKDGRVQFRYSAEETLVALIGQSDLSVGVADPSAPKCRKLELRSGRLTVQAAKQKPGSPFVVLTPQARVEIKGTRFALTVEGTGNAERASLPPRQSGGGWQGARNNGAKTPPENSAFRPAAAGSPLRSEVPSSELGSTRLEVLEGLVGIERLSDGKSVDVAAGQYAVAAEGVELVALALDDDALRVAETAFRSEMRGMSKSRYGKVLFDDDFADSLANWDVVVGTKEGGYRVLTGDPAPYARLAENLCHTDNWQKAQLHTVVLESCLVLDPEVEPDGFVWIRSKKPIDAARFVVEMRGACSPTWRGKGGGSWIQGNGIEVSDAKITDEMVKPAYMEYGAGVLLHRWEFTPGELAAHGDSIYCRMFRGFARPLNEWDKTDCGFFRSCYMRPESRRLLLGIKGSGWRMIIDRVTVREILDDDVADSIQR